MRIYLKTSPNTELVPFDYQAALVGAFHRWLGNNSLHDELSLYSLSWLNRGERVHKGLNFPEGGEYFISAPETDLIKRIIDGIQRDAGIGYGMEVREVVLRPTPEFGFRQRFVARSPILIKRTLEKRQVQFYYPEDGESDRLLTETLHRKLEVAGLPTEVQVSFDRTYAQPKKKLCRYKGIDNKGTLCPVIVSGDPAAVAFAWEVGIGNSTGIGFGAIE